VQLRPVCAACSYGLAEEFLAGWLAGRGHADVIVGSKRGYRYTGGWRLDAPVQEVKEHSLAMFTTQLAQSRALLGDRLTLYQVHSLTPDSGLFTDAPAAGGAVPAARRRCDHRAEPPAEVEVSPMPGRVPGVLPAGAAAGRAAAG